MFDLSLLQKHMETGAMIPHTHTGSHFSKIVKEKWEGLVNFNFHRTTCSKDVFQSHQTHQMWMCFFFFFFFNCHRNAYHDYSRKYYYIRFSRVLFQRTFFSLVSLSFPLRICVYNEHYKLFGGKCMIRTYTMLMIAYIHQ